MNVKTHQIRTIILSPDPDARECVRRLLSALDGFLVAADMEASQAAREYILRSRPELMLLSVQLDGTDAFSFIDALPDGTRPALVFMSDSPDDAARAFEYDAVDCVVRPCTPERILRTAQKVRQALRWNARAQRMEAGNGWSRAYGNGSEGEGRFLDRLAVKTRERVYFVKLSEVDWIEAAADYVQVHALGRKHIIRAKIGDLERKLDGSRFVRIHRSAIVQIDRIAELRPLYHGDFQVVLTDHTELTLSRGYRSKLSAVLVNAL